ncbi:MAG: hypothetical protein RL215_142, partial [Planctomycetota bacterium]
MNLASLFNFPRRVSHRFRRPTRRNVNTRNRVADSQFLEPRLLLTADILEPNNTQTAATPILTSNYYEELSIHNGTDKDYFRLPAATSQIRSGYVAIDFSHAAGDLDMRLRDSNGNVVRDSSGVDDYEEIDLAGLAAGTYFIEVYGYNEATGDYQATFDLPYVPDAFEPNNTRQTATAISGDLSEQNFEVFGLSIHNGSDVDWGRITTTEVGTAEHFFSIYFSHAEGDLDVRLYRDGDPDDNPIRTSTGTNDEERISFEGLPAGTYYAQVYGFLGATGSYDLQVNLPIATQLNPDSDEGPNGNGNNTWQTATSIAEPGTRTGRTIHNDTDDDFYKIQLTSPGTADSFAGITFQHSQGDLDIFLLDSAGNFLTSSNGVTDTERISLEGRPAGTYYLQVYGYAGATGTYDAQFSFPRSTGDRFESNDTRLTATDIRQQRIVSDLSIHTSVDQDYFRIYLPQNSTSAHRVDMTLAAGAGDLDLKLYNSAGDLVGSSMGVGSTESISFSGLPAGDYFIHAYGYNGSTGNYSLAISLPEGLVADSDEANNTRETATVITQSGTRSNRTIHNNADFDFYRFAIPAQGSQENFVAISFVHAAGDLDIQLLDASGAVVGSSLGVTDSERISLANLPVGTYYLQVYGFGGATGTYSARFNLPTRLGDRFESNETRETAKDLGTERDIRDLSIHSNTDQDYFRFTLPAGAGAAHSVTMNILQGGGDLDLELYNSAGTLVGSSLGVGSTENISLSGFQPGDYFIHAYGYGGATGNYTLQLTLPTGSQGLQPDRFEPNNSQETATLIQTSGRVENLTVTAPSGLGVGDRDFFRFTLPTTATSQHSVSIAFNHAAGDLDMVLRNGLGTQILASTGVSNSETIPLVGLAPGDYFLEVYGFLGATGAYSADFNLPTRAGLNADRYEVNNSITTATPLRQSEVLGNLTIHTATDNDYFAFNLPSDGRRGAVTARFLHADGNLDMEVQNRNGSVLLRSTGIVDNETLQFDSLPSLPAGQNYFIRVYGRDGATAPYELDFQLAESVDRFEANNTFATATNLRTIVVGENIDNVWLHTNPDASIDQDFYRFAIAAAGTSAHTVRIASQRPISMQLLTGNGQILSTARPSLGVTSRSVQTGGFNQLYEVSLNGLQEGSYGLRVFESGGNAGAYRLTFVTPRGADPIPSDRYEPNNQSATASGLGAVEGVREVGNLTIHTASDEDWFSIDLLAAAGPSDVIVATPGTADLNLDLELQNAQGQQLRSASGAAATERLSLNGLAAGRYFVRVNARDRGVGTYGLSLTGPMRRSGFDITLRFDDTNLNAAQRAVFQEAAARWSQIITADLPDTVTAAGDGIAAGVAVDDVLIGVTAPTIDGAGRILGQAGPRQYRAGTALPFYGIMRFDIADIQEMERNGTFRDVILHEMGHVLGIGTIWQRKSLVTGVGGTNPQYLGTGALGEYRTLAGSSTVTGIPLENTGGAGTRDSHWRETVFDNELMTGYANRGSMPISRMTIAQLRDLGYTVDLNRADAYSLPRGASLMSGDSGEEESEGDFQVVGILEPGTNVDGESSGINDDSIFVRPTAEDFGLLYSEDVYESSLAEASIPLDQAALIDDLTLSSVSDEDRFTITLENRGTAEDAVSVFLTSGHPDDLRLRLLDSNGNVVSENLNGESRISLAGFQGTYTLVVT